ncbi:MAG: hypothetical protein O3B64_00700 [bacterium]|nr:hypothetical protein [bacterium]
MKQIGSFLVRLYFIVISAIALIMLAVSSAQLLETGLKTYVFKAADVPRYLETCTEFDLRVPKDEEEFTDTQLLENCERRREISIESYAQEKAQQAVQNLSFFLIFLPLFFLHFRIVWNEYKKENLSK